MASLCVRILYNNPLQNPEGRAKSGPWSAIFIICLFRNVNTCLSGIREEVPVSETKTSKIKMTSKILSNTQ